MPFPTFKTKDEIPKGFESEYEEKDGAWHAKVADTTALDATLAKVRDEKKASDKRAKEAEDKAADAQRRLDAKEANGADTDKKVADLLAKWKLDTDAAVKVKQDELDKVSADLRAVKLDDKIKAAALAAGVLRTRVDAVLKLTKDTFDLADDRIVVKDDKGAVTTTTVEDYFGKTYRAQMPELYQGTKANGGGGTGGLGKGTVKDTGDAAERVIKDPLAMLREANEKAAAA